MEPELKRLMAQWLTAVAARDTASLARLVSADCRITDLNGNVRDAPWSPGVTNVSCNQKVDRVQVYGGAAVVTGVYTLRMQPPTGQRRAVYYVPQRYTFVWTKQNGAWKIVAAQFTRIVES